VSWLSHQPQYGGPGSIPGQSMRGFGRQSSTGTGFSLSTCAFPCHCHSTIVELNLYAFYESKIGWIYISSILIHFSITDTV